MAVNNELIKDDLYEAVNGEWLKTAKIPDDKPATGGFNDLVDEIDKQLMEIVKNTLKTCTPATCSAKINFFTVM